MRYYHIIILFGKRQVSYEIENLEADLLIEYKFLKEINAVINLKKNKLIINNKREEIYLFYIRM